jgi:flavodoxin short chain
MSKAAIIFWSGTGNTEAMANALAQGMKEAGSEVDLLNVAAAKADALDEYEKIAFGCPSMGDEILEEDEFEPFFASAEGGISGKKIALFGSYGWGDGQWMRDWQDRVKGAGADLFEEGFIVQEGSDEPAAAAFGKRFAAY